MLVLYILYHCEGKVRKTPRVHLLSPLYDEAKNNFFRFFSVTGFRLKIFALKFNREVEINKLNLKYIHRAIDMFR